MGGSQLEMKFITPYEFQTEFLNMKQDDSTKANKILQDYQQLSIFSFVDTLDDFFDRMDQISDLWQDVNELGYDDGLIEFKNTFGFLEVNP